LAQESQNWASLELIGMSDGTPDCPVGRMIKVPSLMNYLIIHQKCYNALFGVHRTTPPMAPSNDSLAPTANWHTRLSGGAPNCSVPVTP
jgi:hypothetical protein